MLHADLKAFLQRRLQDTVEDQFASAVLDKLLAVGISKLQAHIHEVNPAAFSATNTFPTVAGTDTYTKQVSSMRVIRAEMLKTSGGYVKIPQRNFLELLDESDSGFAEDSVAIADLGTQWLMRPTPTSVRTVRVWYVPIITDSTGWDAVATQIPPALHFAAVDFALIEALGETGEPGKDAMARLSEALSLIPALYGRTNEQVAPLSLNPFSSVGA